MKVSLKSRTGSTVKKLGISECLELAKSIQEGACGLAFADFLLSKHRESQARDKAVQVVDVEAGLATMARRAEAISKSLKDSGYDKLGREAKSIGTGVAKLRNKLAPPGKRKVGRVSKDKAEKLENGVKKLKARMEQVWTETKEACRVRK